jgi:DNA-binding NtrC family response regulator
VILPIRTSWIASKVWGRPITQPLRFAPGDSSLVSFTRTARCCAGPAAGASPPQPASTATFRRKLAATFRADLFYRLAVVRLRVPPLRERPEDIEPLAQHLLAQASRRFGLEGPPPLSPAALQQIVTHRWPGNVRELRNFCERLVALSGDGEAPHATPPSRDAVDETADLAFNEAKAEWVARFDVQCLTRLLERCQGNVAEAARKSGIDRVHLFRLIKKYGLRQS